MRITKRGRELAVVLEPYIGIPDNAASNCSLLCWNAKRHHTAQEHVCSTEGYVDPSEAIEARVRELAGLLGVRVTFGGDPRGYTVKLHVEGDKLYNTWGGAESGYGI